MSDGNRPSWLPPPAKARPESAVLSPETLAAAVESSRSPDVGETGKKALYNWPLAAPYRGQLDVNAQQIDKLRSARIQSIIAGNPALAGLLPDWWPLIDALVAEVITHIDRRVICSVQSFTVGVVAITLRPEEHRRYFFIQNTHAANTLFLGLGFTPTAVQCVTIPAGGFYEPLCFPQNEIIVLGSGAGTTGAIVYAN